MTDSAEFEIQLVCPPGMQETLRGEARELGLPKSRSTPVGVTMMGGWEDVWRANLELRGASRVLIRIAEFRVPHLAQLDKRARKMDWGAWLKPGEPVKVEAVCKRSKIYHERAAVERIENALREEFGAPIDPKAVVRVMARIDDDLCTLSLDTSGAPLHQRGHKEAVGKAPLRESLAAMFLRQAGYTGAEPVVDPMCGSGTIPIEAAEIALGLLPGRSRRFAFENMASFDRPAWESLRNRPAQPKPDLRFYGYDRDDGAVLRSRENAQRAEVTAVTQFSRQAISALEPPKGPKGLVLVNPPYGARIGDKKELFALYGALGKTLLNGFAGWRVGIITSEPGLAKTTGLPLLAPGPITPHGGLKIRLYRTDPLPG
ncbi:MAG: THUMP domain-containing class I SAM-dependent RNA methyltransferase [Mangrovicoccus sp.]